MSTYTICYRMGSRLPTAENRADHSIVPVACRARNPCPYLVSKETADLLSARSMEAQRTCTGHEWATRPELSLLTAVTHGYSPPSPSTNVGPGRLPLVPPIFEAGLLPALVRGRLC
jgi:hypothetical protein